MEELTVNMIPHTVTPTDSHDWKRIVCIHAVPRIAITIQIIIIQKRITSNSKTKQHVV